MQNPEPPNSAGTQDLGATPFSCNICRKSYTRIDHLARHHRSHSQEKPFRCDACDKVFARSDLLKRHASCHSNEGSQSNKKQKVSQSMRPRTAQACVGCAEAKLRCEGPAPCKRCQRKGWTCTYPKSQPKDGISQSGSTDLAVESGTIDEIEMNAPPLEPINEHINEEEDFQAELSNVVADPKTATNQEVPLTNNGAQRSATPAVDIAMTLAPSESLTSPNNGVTGDDHHFVDFLNDVMMPYSPAGEGYPSRPDHMSDFSPRDVLDFTADTIFGMPDIFDSSFQLPADFSFNPARYNENIDGPNRSGYTTPGVRGGISLGAQAFRESLWLWTPAQEDYGAAEQLNLSVPSEDLMPEIQNSPLETLVGSVDRIARDRVLAMVLESCDAAVVPRLVQSFPSSDLLTSLVRNFFEHHSMATDSWVHMASFDPKSESPQMLTAVMAAGAVISNLPDVRKLGFALWEALRDATSRMFERDNRHTRALRPMQAFTLQLDVGLWSGDRRKMEIAESFSQPIITMMRRGGRFRQPRQTIVPPDHSDDETTTEFKWHQWVEAESFRRLAFHLLIRDCSTSISLLVPPSISYSEVSIDMPASRALWAARNASEWKELYLKMFSGISPRLPSLHTCVDGFFRITKAKKLLDIDLVIVITLSALWALTWQYRETTTSIKHLNDSGVRSSTLAINLMYQETSQTLLHFRMAAKEWTGEMKPLAQVLYERQLMHLHVSLEDVQLVAGKDGEEEARRVFPLLGAWVESKESRLALWHAGQVIRAARGYRRANLRFSSAIALYHASLVVWAYSVVSKPPESLHGITQDRILDKETETDTSFVRLDGEDNPDVQKFLVLGIGSPAIGQGEEEFPTYSSQIIPISDAKRVMLTTTSLLRRKNETGPTGCPPLVENLMKLMRTLGNAAQGIRRQRKSLGGE